MVYRILSIDGGGVRGAFALKMLKFIEEEVDKDFLQKVDCFAGTSTGGLIATCLNLGMSPRRLLFYYKHLSPLVFPKNGDGNSKYRHDRLRKVLSVIIPKDLQMDGLKKDLIIPACRLYHSRKKRWKEEIYDTFGDCREKIIDVAVRSAAAPLYFPSYQGYVDGGVYAVNPSLLAYSRVIDPSVGGVDPEEVRLLSLGNGVNPTGIQGEVDWGIEDWMGEKLRLFELMTDMGMQAPHYPLKQILQGRYRRLNTILKGEVAIDDTKKVKTLIDSAEMFRKEHQDIWTMDKAWLHEVYLGDQEELKKTG
ncbi:patatin-like phospholipase family protein [bacterium]|nr:patatin-like phospholipase family protein [bacterium]